MATLADELLNDFEDGSGAECEEDAELQENVLLGLRKDSVTEDMEVDENEASEEAAPSEFANEHKEEMTEEEETKAKVDKMQLAGVSDVRSVARLLKTLQPVLQVSYHFQSRT